MTNLKLCPFCGTEASFQLAAADLIGIAVYMHLQNHDGRQ